MKTLLLAGLLASQAAWAQSPQAPQSPPTPQAPPAPLPRVVPDASGGEAAAEAFRKLPVCSLAPDGRKLLVEPCRPAPARNVTQRRAVPLTIQPLPRASVPPPVALPAIPPTQPLDALMRPPGSPVPLLSCDPAGCFDTSGARHNNAGSGASVSPSGKLCQRNGAWLQC